MVRHSNSAFGLAVVAAVASWFMAAPAAGQAAEQGPTPAAAQSGAAARGGGGNRREAFGQEHLTAGCPSDPVPFYACAKEKARAFQPPLTAEGKPNFQGYWNTGRQAFDIEDHPDSFAYAGEPTLIVDPTNGKVPYQPWAAAKKAERAERTLDPPSIEFVDPNAQCFLRGVPRQMWIMDYQFIQPPGAHSIFVAYEQNHAYRIVPMDGRAHLGSGVTLWMGDSRGHWEGNTLVIETTNTNGRNWLDNTGNFFSPSGTVTERLAFVDADTILYEARIDDPTVFTQPWTLTFPLRRNKTPGFQLMEFACQEGNKSLELQLGHAKSATK